MGSRTLLGYIAAFFSRAGYKDGSSQRMGM
jgi:hypothetical protein